MKSALRNKLLWTAVNVARLLLSATFIFSGVVKLVDPMGTAYKIQDYASAFGTSQWLTAPLPTLFAVLLASVEFVLGIQLFFGVKAKRTTWLTLLFLLVMTPLTLYLFVTDVVVDCGCFGEAVHLSNGETLAKNVLLLALALLLVVYYRYIWTPNTRRTRWIVSLYAWVFAFGFAATNLYGLPLMDFRPFRTGTDMWQGMNDFEHLSLLQDFGMWDPVAKDDITEQFLQQPGYKMLLTMPTVETADDGVMDCLLALSDYCRLHGYPLYALTSSSEEAIAHWTDVTGAEYPFCQTDALVLKTMVRSNPGLVLLHGSTILGKWASTQLPTGSDLKQPLEEAVWAQPDGLSTAARALRIALWFALPLLLIALLDWAWTQWHKRQEKNKKQQFSINHKNDKTMRKKIVAGNWKMNKTLQEGVALATELKDMLAAEKPNCEVIIGTPFIHLATVSELLKDSVIAVSAENCANKESGAYTGEVSAAMVKSTGAEYVILGHSERREYYNETPEILKEKVDLALANGLKVIFCIGESLAEREANQQEAVCKAELAGSVFHLTAEQWKNVVIAYEPIWAIGTGKTATSDQAEEIHAYIRSCVAEVYGAEVADETSILYGGSCKASNAPELFAKPDIDGGLIGGASLKAPDFKGIIDAWK